MTKILGPATVIFFGIVELLILLRAIFSWFPVGRDGRFSVFVQTVTEPVLSPIRKLIAKSEVGRNLMVDFSPLLAYLLLRLAEHIIILVINKF